MSNQATAVAATLNGIEALPVRVTAEIGVGAGLEIVGLIQGARKRETSVRVRSSMDHFGYAVPDRVIVAVSPATLGTFDLAIAGAILAASGVFPRVCLSGWMLVGELSLGGKLLPVRGVLAMAQAAKTAGLRGIIVPRENGAEAALVEGLEVLAAASLESVVAFFVRNEGVTDGSGLTPPDDGAAVITSDLSDIRSQDRAKRALEIAATGGHNVLFVGPPGACKTILARALPDLLPTMTTAQALAVIGVASVAGMPLGHARRPFRAPHHTVSTMGMVGGGGDPPRPGEVSLAHQGVLFLDELPEFSPEALRAVVGALDARSVTVRGHTFPAQFQLVGAMMPCPCGHYGSNLCGCSPERARAYRGRVERTTLNLFEMIVPLEAVGFEKRSVGVVGPSSAEVRARVAAAPALNGLPSNISDEARALFKQLPSALGAGNAVFVATTIARLAGSSEITAEHAAEAVEYQKGV